MHTKWNEQRRKNNNAIPIYNDASTIQSEPYWRAIIVN
jgi:hypothetical protein